MNELVNYIIQVIGSDKPEVIDQFVKKLGEDGMSDLKQAMDSGIEPSQYKKKLLNPKIEMAKTGTALCKDCAKNKKPLMDSIKEDIKKEKCGGKMKKKISKKAEGGKAPIKKKGQAPVDPGAGFVEYDGKNKKFAGHDGKKPLPVDPKTGKKKLVKKNKLGGFIC